MMAALEGARDALAGIAGVQSCKVGFENGISPADYPLIRIEPSLVEPGPPYSARSITAQIIFGAPITNAETLEEVIRQLTILEASIRSALRTLAGYRYLRTLTVEEARSNAYRLWAVECELSEVAAPG